MIFFLLLGIFLFLFLVLFFFFLHLLAVRTHRLTREEGEARRLSAEEGVTGMRMQRKQTQAVATNAVADAQALFAESCQ